MNAFSKHLQLAVRVGMVQIDEQAKTAVILAPPRPESMSGDDWLDVLRAASEVGRELEKLGYTVRY